jgi:hypothetical protein
LAGAEKVIDASATSPYDSPENLIDALDDAVIDPALKNVTN